MKVQGIHHITAVASDPQQTVHFWEKTLGLRLVKKSVNQDQVEAYHLFFGDRTGEPGMDMTFFTFSSVHKGNKGVGVVSRVSLGVPEQALEFWQQRLVQAKVQVRKIEKRFGRLRLEFEDFDGAEYELVGVGEKEFGQAVKDVWSKEVSATEAIGYFAGARMAVTSRQLIVPVLTEVLGYVAGDEEDGAEEYYLEGVSRAGRLEVVELPNAEQVYGGAGTVHHIAFQVADEAELRAMRERVAEFGLYPTGIIDRYYFKSVYFRTPAGILFELATNGPGFTVDEDEATLGEKLALPPFLEDKREYIESLLPEIIR